MCKLVASYAAGYSTRKKKGHLTLSHFGFKFHSVMLGEGFLVFSLLGCGVPTGTYFEITPPGQPIVPEGIKGFSH